MLHDNSFSDVPWIFGETFEKSQGNCGNIAWKLSFSTGFAWWRTFLRPYFAIAAGFRCWCVATLFWANVSSWRIINLPVLNLCRLFDALRGQSNALGRLSFDIREESQKPRHFVCGRNIVKIHECLVLSFLCDHQYDFYLEYSFHDRKV